MFGFFVDKGGDVLLVPSVYTHTGPRCSRSWIFESLHLLDFCLFSRVVFFRCISADGEGGILYFFVSCFICFYFGFGVDVIGQLCEFESWFVVVHCDFG